MPDSSEYTSRITTNVGIPVEHRITSTIWPTGPPYILADPEALEKFLRKDNTT